MDDKKKIAILGALFVVMIGVGAFQFVKAGAPEQPAPAPKEQPTGEVKTEEAKTEESETNQTAPKGVAVEGAEGDPAAKSESAEPEVDPALILAAKLTPRDPFDGRKWDKSLLGQNPDPSQQPQPKVAQHYVPRRPSGLSGDLRPINPGLDSLVAPTGAGVPAAMPNINEFQWSVSGTVEGSKPCAVFTDSAGKQKLVTVGSSIDGDSELVSISKGKVVVRHRGEVKSFSVGGVTPSEKKQEGNQ